MTQQSHITLLGVLHIARGALLLLIGVALFIILTAAGVLSEDETAVGVLAIIATVIMFIFLIIAIPSIVAGIGVLMRREWGRITALVVGVLSLVDIPIGTALGVYTIWILMNDEMRPLFQGTSASHTPTPMPVAQQ
jgi:hypothetical protein